MSENTANDEKIYLTISSLGAILGFILPLIMWAVKKEEFSDYTKKFLLDVLNFELVLFIINIVLCLIPVLGWFGSILLFVMNLIVALRAFSATQNKQEYSFPIKFQLIK